MDGAAISAAAATALGAWQLVPQVAKVRRVESTIGLSPAWVVFGLILNAGWLVYRWSQALWLGLVSPLAALVLYGLLLALMARTDRALSSAAVGALAMSVSLGIGAVIGGWLVFGLLLAVSSFVQVAPSVWAAFRTADLRAVASGMWSIGLAQAVAWGAYGWLQNDRALVVYGVTTGVGAAVILVRCGYTKRRCPVAVTPAPERR